jgi:hypothetical protein
MKGTPITDGISVLLVFASGMLFMMAGFGTPIPPWALGFGGAAVTSTVCALMCRSITDRSGR